MTHHFLSDAGVSDLAPVSFVVASAALLSFIGQGCKRKGFGTIRSKADAPAGRRRAAFSLSYNEAGDSKQEMTWCGAQLDNDNNAFRNVNPALQRRVLSLPSRNTEGAIEGNVVKTGRGHESLTKIGTRFLVPLQELRVVGTRSCAG